MQTSAGPGSRSWRGLAVLVTFVAVTSLWSVIGFVLVSDFRTGSDLGIFTQAARSMASGHQPVSSLKGENFPLWGDHFHPIIVFTGIAYRMWPDPRSLMLLQAAAVALGAGIIVDTASRLFPVARTFLAALTGAAFALSLGVQSAMVFDFHEVSLGVPILALCMRSYLLNRKRSYLVYGLLCLLIKEDVALFVVGLGLTALARRWHRVGWTLCVGGVAWLAVVTKLIIPAFAHGAWAYTDAVPHSFSLITANLTHNLLHSAPLTRTVVMLLIGGGIACLRSPLLLALIPNLASRAVASKPAYQVIGYHYNLLPCVIITAAFLDAVIRRSTDCRTPQKPAAVPTMRWRLPVVATLLICSILYSLWRGPLIHINTPAGDKPHNAQQAIAAIPPEAPVAADAYLLAQLAQHHTVLREIDPTPCEGQVWGCGFPTIKWVIIDRSSINHADQPGWIHNLTATLTTHGWHITRTYGSYDVYHHE